MQLTTSNISVDIKKELVCLVFQIVQKLDHQTSLRLCGFPYNKSLLLRSFFLQVPLQILSWTESMDGSAN